MLCVVVWLLLAADLFLQTNAGARVTMEAIAFVFEELLWKLAAPAPTPVTPRSANTTVPTISPLKALMSNFAMARPGTLLGACALVPVGAALQLLARWQVRAGQSRLLALGAVLGVSLLVPTPCCRSTAPSAPRFDTALDVATGQLLVRSTSHTRPWAAIAWERLTRVLSAPVKCSPRHRTAHAPNVLGVLLVDATWAALGAREGAHSQPMRALTSRLAAAANERAGGGGGGGGGGSGTARQEHVAAADGGSGGGGGGGSGGGGSGTAGAARAPWPYSRNVLLVSMESIGALYTDLYNADAATMPFLRSLYESSPNGTAALVDYYYASEPNTVHSLFAALCGLRPYAGLARREYDDDARKRAACLPNKLAARGVHTAFYTTSNVGYQSGLGFAELWSGVEQWPPPDIAATAATDGSAAGTGGVGSSGGGVGSSGGGGSGSSSRSGSSSSKAWPREWWHYARNASEIQPGVGPAAKARNWLGHHDAYGLPFVADYIARRAASRERFFLHVLTLGTHHPFHSTCPLSVGEQEAKAKAKAAPHSSSFSFSSSTAASALAAIAAAAEPHLRTRVGGEFASGPRTAADQRETLRRFLRLVRCMDRYLEQLYLLLQRAGRLHDTSLIVTSDHGEGFQIGHSNDFVHGGSVYDTQARIPLVIFGPMAHGLRSKRVEGVWSDTSLAPTILHAMTGEATAGVAAVASGDAAAVSAAAASGGGGAAASGGGSGADGGGADGGGADGGGGAGASQERPTVGVDDLVGSSILLAAHRGAPPSERAYMSCAFDATCLGLVLRERGSGEVRKFVWHMGLYDNLLQAYELGPDPFEERSVASRLTVRARDETIGRMHVWLHTTQAMHPRVYSNGGTSLGGDGGAGRSGGGGGGGGVSGGVAADARTPFATASPRWAAADVSRIVLAAALVCIFGCYRRRVRTCRPQRHIGGR